MTGSGTVRREVTVTLMRIQMNSARVEVCAVNILMMEILGGQKQLIYVCPVNLV